MTAYAYAYLYGPTTCPLCGQWNEPDYWDGLLKFRWGYCSEEEPVQDLVYMVGKPIRWRACPDGSIPAWTRFGPSACNFGDPAVADLIVRDHAMRNRSCGRCARRIGGGAVEIRGGLITRAWLYAPGEVGDEADWYLITEGEELLPIPDWEGHPMPQADPSCLGTGDVKDPFRTSTPDTRSARAVIRSFSRAYVKGDLRCPACGEPLEELRGAVGFRWGYCADWVQAAIFLPYRVGDALRWRVCADGSIPSWTYFGPPEANVGDPAVGDLLVRGNQEGGSTCDKCGRAIGGTAVEIRGGVITRAWAYPPGELPDEALVHLVGPGGELVPMPDWDHHPMAGPDPECVGERDFMRLGVRIREGAGTVAAVGGVPLAQRMSQPALAHVRADTRCPSCDLFWEELRGLLRFQWGYCPGHEPVLHLIYRTGDAIRWRACAGGSIPAWTYFGPSEANVGDPEIEDLVVRDWGLAGWKCPRCGGRIGGGAVAIRGGVIVRVWLYPPGELDNEAGVYRIAGGGELVAMPQWGQHPMSEADAQCFGSARAVEMLRTLDGRPRCL